MDEDARIAILEQTALFKDVDRSTIAAAARSAGEQAVKKNELLFRQGEDAALSYLVAWGRFRLDQTTIDGRNIVIRYMTTGDLIGTVAVLRQKPYPATPVAIESSMALYWSAATKAKMIFEHPQLSINAVNMVGGRIEEMMERLQEVSTQRVERRIAATLLRMLRRAGRHVEGGVEIPFIVSRHEIAEMNATTMHTVSRTLATWEQEGILTGKRSSHLIITQPHRLAEIAEQE